MAFFSANIVCVLFLQLKIFFFFKKEMVLANLVKNARFHQCVPFLTSSYAHSYILRAPYI